MSDSTPTWRHLADDDENGPAGMQFQRSRPAERDWFHWLLERAEDAGAAGLSYEDAIEAVRCGYSSLAADKSAREDP